MVKKINKKIINLIIEYRGVILLFNTILFYLYLINKTYKKKIYKNIYITN